MDQLGPFHPGGGARGSPRTRPPWAGALSVGVDMRVRLHRYSGVPEAQDLRERAARLSVRPVRSSSTYGPGKRDHTTLGESEAGGAQVRGEFRPGYGLLIVSG